MRGMLHYGYSLSCIIGTLALVLMMCFCFSFYSMVHGIIRSLNSLLHDDTNVPSGHAIPKGVCVRAMLLIVVFAIELMFKLLLRNSTDDCSVAFHPRISSSLHHNL